MTFLRSLSNRIFVAGALLAVAPLGVAIYAVNVAVTQQAEDELARGLTEAATLVGDYRTTLFEHFAREARLTADLPRMKATVDLNDPPTAAPIAEEYRLLIGCDLLGLTHRTGRLLAQSGGAALGDTPLVARTSVREAATGRESRDFWTYPGGVLQVVSVPVWIGEPPEILGTLSVGQTLDQEAAARFKALTNSDVAFAIDGQIRAATLSPAHWPALARLLSGAGPIVHLGEDDYVWLAQPLPGQPAGATSSVPTALILRSRTERLRFLDALHRALGATAVGAVLLATILSYAVARTVTKPLAVITATMRETATTGDLTRRIALPQSGLGPLGDDEDAQVLAATFNTMTESIARFQREAALRERLSSLGRLSTVVAHEIRNPLMIIKANLRTLRRDDLQPAQLRQAVADIDEEIARLNRLVTDVLDFARPIKFDVAPIDLNAVCRDAARAAVEGEEQPSVQVTADPALPPVVTDAERMRVALVNVLTNARHAVEGRGARAPAIYVATRRLSPDRVAVIVRDRGVGIRPEDLPRVFEPYFTTKRTGSGLGLAIARNIIEGLGGTIALSSRAGEGTEIAIELPVAPTGGQSPFYENGKKVTVPNV
jgi:signal transduction histidine kinase